MEKVKMNDKLAEGLIEFLEGKIEVFSRLTSLYEGSGDARAHITASIIRDLEEVSKAVASRSHRDEPSGLPEQPTGESSRFALIIEVAAEFTVRLYRTREEAENAYHAFRENNESMFYDGEISADVVEINSLELQRAGIFTPGLAYFYACGLEGRIDISFFPDKSRRDNAIRDFRDGDEYDPDEHLIGSGAVFFD
jgi:hypothetical protein